MLSVLCDAVTRLSAPREASGAPAEGSEEARVAQMLSLPMVVGHLHSRRGMSKGVLAVSGEQNPSHLER